MATTTLTQTTTDKAVKPPKVPQIHVSVTGEFGAMLECLAEHLGVSKTAVIRMAVKQMYDRHFPKPHPND